MESEGNFMRLLYLIFFCKENSYTQVDVNNMICSIIFHLCRELALRLCLYEAGRERASEKRLENRSQPGTLSLARSLRRIADGADENPVVYLSLNNKPSTEGLTERGKKKRLRHREETNQGNITSQQPEGKTRTHATQSTCAVAQ